MFPLLCDVSSDHRNKANTPDMHMQVGIRRRFRGAGEVLPDYPYYAYPKAGIFEQMNCDFHWNFCLKLIEQ